MAYNPNLYLPQGYQQSYPQPMAWQQPVQQPVNGLVSVTGIEGAKAYQMPPNSSMPLFDANEDILYVKTTDSGGYPTIRAFQFTPLEQQAQPQQDYVTRADFDALVAKVDGLTPKTRTTRKAAADGE